MTAAFELSGKGFAQDHEPRIGHCLHDHVRGRNEIALTFVRHQRRDVPDERGVVRQHAELAFRTGEHDGVHGVGVGQSLRGDDLKLDAHAITALRSILADGPTGGAGRRAAQRALGGAP